MPLVDYLPNKHKHTFHVKVEQQQKFAYLRKHFSAFLCCSWHACKEEFPSCNKLFYHGLKFSCIIGGTTCCVLQSSNLCQWLQRTDNNEPIVTPFNFILCPSINMNLMFLLKSINNGKPISVYYKFCSDLLSVFITDLHKETFLNPYSNTLISLQMLSTKETFFEYDDERMSKLISCLNCCTNDNILKKSNKWKIIIKNIHFISIFSFFHGRTHVDRATYPSRKQDNEYINTKKFFCLPSLYLK